MTCLLCLLCDNLKYELGEAILTVSLLKPGSAVQNGANSQTVFSSVCEQVQRELERGNKALCSLKCRMAPISPFKTQ